MLIEKMDRADLEITILENDIVPIEDITSETTDSQLREIVRKWVVEGNEIQY